MSKLISVFITDLNSKVFFFFFKFVVCNQTGNHQQKKKKKRKKTKPNLAIGCLHMEI
jgi:hypothetical protein